MTRARPIDIALKVWLSMPGRDQSSLARELGVDPQHVTNWKARGMPAERHAAMAQVLGISVDQLLGLKPLTPNVGGGSLNEPPGRYGVASQGAQSTGRLQVSEVVRAQSGGQLVAIDASDDAPRGFVDIHQSHGDLLALRVRGDGLSPAIEDGEILIIDLAARPQAGERVLVRLTSGDRLCKRLLFERNDAISVADLGTKQISTLALADVQSMHPVSAVYSAHRWSPE